MLFYIYVFPIIYTTYIDSKYTFLMFIKNYLQNYPMDFIDRLMANHKFYQIQKNNQT